MLANWKVDAGYTWAQVAAGRADARIKREAQHLSDNFRTKFYLAIHHEPENEVNANAGSGRTAKDYAAMYRHVVSVLRNNGATNIVPVLSLMGSQKWADRAWFNDLYPGDKYVGWIGFDPYAASTLGSPGGLLPRDDGSALRRQDQVARRLRLGDQDPPRQADHVRRVGTG